MMSRNLWRCGSFVSLVYFDIMGGIVRLVMHEKTGNGFDR
jgi:hypothetical protein